MKTTSQYTVGAVKTIRGHDGNGYSCNLLRNGKKVAEIFDDGWGGGLQFGWLDHTTRAVVHNRTYDDKPHSYNGTVEEALFNAYIMELPKVPSYDGKEEIFTDPDIFVDELVNDTLTLKQIKSDLKKNITIQCKDGQLLSWKVSPVHTADILKAHALKQHPDGIIINTLPVETVFDIYKKANIVQ